ncbi:Septin-2A [Escovopsis weberi]|uniref:Septin-2A n=1 Tax=Escovopsis weberi TaxID=150374 RepID=A0A0M9VSM5_ESCWE|nr:Septin-2A [Escovopsis weberi]
MLLKGSKSSEFDKELKKGHSPKRLTLSRQKIATLHPPPKLPEFISNGQLLSNSLEPNLPPGNAMQTQPMFDSYPRPSMDPGPVFLDGPPPIPIRGGELSDRSESMTHRSRTSYTSMNTNGPRRVRRRKDPTPFNILILGTRDSGKTSFIEFLKTALALPPKKTSKKAEEEAIRVFPRPLGSFIPHCFETEIDGERIAITLWDSEGLEKNVVDLQLRDLSAFVESKFEETFAEEMKVMRSPHVQDTHIHAAFLLLDPSRLARNMAPAKGPSSDPFSGNDFHPATHSSRSLAVLDQELDIQTLRALHHKTAVIPVISKADTITVKQMGVLKRAVWDGLQALKMDPLEGLGTDEDSDSLEEDEDDEDQRPFHNNQYIEQLSTIQGLAISPPATPNQNPRLSRQSLRRHKAQQDLKEEHKEEETPFFPLSIISPDPCEPDVVGRQFAWGFADPFDERHCDYQRFQEAVFREWRAELREVSREQWYEEWRTSRLKGTGMPANRI